MEPLEPSQVGDAREVFGSMVLQVVHKGEIVVSGIEPEDQQGGDAGRQHEPDERPDRERPGHDDEERRADERPGVRVVSRVTPPGHGRWAVQDPPMKDILEQSPGHEPHDDGDAGHDVEAGEPIEPKHQKRQSPDHVTEQPDPVIGRAGDHPIQRAEQGPSGLSGHLFT